MEIEITGIVQSNLVMRVVLVVVVVHVLVLVLVLVLVEGINVMIIKSLTTIGIRAAAMDGVGNQVLHRVLVVGIMALRLKKWIIAMTSNVGIKDVPVAIG